MQQINRLGIAYSFTLVKASIQVGKFFLISWPLDVMRCSFIYGPIKWSSTYTALLLHRVSPFHGNFTQEPDVDQDNEESTNFVSFLEEHTEALPGGVAISYVDEKLLGSFFGRMAHTIAYYTGLDYVRELVEPKFLKGAFADRAISTYEYGYDGLQLLESLEPAWNILVNNKHPGAIITFGSDFKKDLNIVIEYYKFIFSKFVNITHLLDDSGEQDLAAAWDVFTPNHIDTGSTCQIVQVTGLHDD